MNAPEQSPGMAAREDCLGLILAGGLSRRMGENKSLTPLLGRPLILHVAERLQPQCAMLIVSDNEQATQSLHKLPIITDLDEARLGPLAGIEAGLAFIASRALPMNWLLSAPVDTPFLPADLAERLLGACLAEGRRVAMARTGGEDHPTVGLWHVSLLEDLSACLHRDEMRRVRSFADRHDAVRVDWPIRDATRADPFFNINTPADLARATRQQRRAADRLLALRAQ